MEGLLCLIPPDLPAFQGDFGPIIYLAAPHNQQD